MTQPCNIDLTYISWSSNFIFYLDVYFMYVHNSGFWLCMRGWLGGVKVSCILCHWGVQLILAYSWARPAILVAGKGREVIFYFFCFYTFIHVPLSSLSLSFIFSAISSVSFLPFSGRRHKMTHKGWRVVKPQHRTQTLYDPKFDFKINIGHCDLYFMVEWCGLTSWMLFDVWTLLFGIINQHHPRLT